MLLKRGREIGIKSGDLYALVACDNCGTERWVKKPDYDSGKQRLCKRCYLQPKMETEHQRIIKEYPGVKDVKNGLELGKASDCLYVLVKCSECCKERWTRLKGYRENMSIKCKSCAAREAIMKLPRFKGRKSKHQGGYVMVYLLPDDPFYRMAGKSHYVMEHRLVMARHLGRPLLKEETVHHRPDVPKDDNRIEGLYLMPDPNTHARLLPCSNCALKKEIRLLRWQIKMQGDQIRELSSKLISGGWDRVA